VVRRMTTRGLAGMALSACFMGPAKTNGLLLGFGGFDEHALIDATRTLGDVLRNRRDDSRHR
jgi:hypothetical protein